MVSSSMLTWVLNSVLVLQVTEVACSSDLPELLPSVHHPGVWLEVLAAGDSVAGPVPLAARICQSVSHLRLVQLKKLLKIYSLWDWVKLGLEMIIICVNVYENGSISLNNCPDALIVFKTLTFRDVLV